MEVSDNALLFWINFFLLPRNTLRFGGEGSKMEITPEARAALDELLAGGYAQRIEPDCQIPGREHYGATEKTLREEWQKRPDWNPWGECKMPKVVWFRFKEAV